MKWFKWKKPSKKNFSKGPSSRAESLAYRPVKSLEVSEEKLESGEVVLTYPLTLRPWLLSLATRLGMRSGENVSRKLQLDEMGSLTWSLLDGKRAVHDLVDFVCRRYKLNRREAEVAMTGFLRDLGKRGLIGFRAPSGEEGEKST
ncbi:MAG: PqqD family protein [Syntrophobacterales bacterium]|jgi:hypothetical protein